MPESMERREGEGEKENIDEGFTKHLWWGILRVSDERAYSDIMLKLYELEVID